MNSDSRSSSANTERNNTRPPTNQSDTSRRAFLALGISGIVGTLSGCPSQSSRQSPERTTTRDGASERQFGTGFTDLYREVIDSVTLIQTATGSGSGWVIDDTGRIVTNEHVVGADDQVDIRYHSDEWRSAEVLGTDPVGDLAVVAPSDPPENATPLPYETMSPPVGSDVSIVGAPFGLPGSLSVGVVSATGRLLESPTGSSIPNSIQVDATANPGNSGGPIFRSDGTVIGVLVAGSGIAVNFGISGALVEKVVPSLIRDGEYRYPSLGVLLQDVDPRVAQANHLDSVSGAIVRQVGSDGPADGKLNQSTSSATVEGATVPVGGDVIVQLDDRTVTSRADYATYLTLSKQPGEKIDVTVLRDGERRTVTMRLGARVTPK